MEASLSRADGERLARLEVGQDELADDVKELKAGLGQIVESLDEKAKVELAHAVEARKDRKADRWKITGAVFSAAGLVISAVAVLGDKL